MQDINKPQRQAKWVVELTEEQLVYTAHCLEDCANFAAGKFDMHNTAKCFGGTYGIDTHIKYAGKDAVPYYPVWAWGSKTLRESHPGRAKFISDCYGMLCGIMERLGMASRIMKMYAKEQGLDSAPSVAVRSMAEFWHETAIAVPKNGQVVLAYPQMEPAVWNDVCGVWHRVYSDGIAEKSEIEYWMEIPSPK